MAIEKKKLGKIFLYLFYFAITIALLIFVLSLGDLSEIGDVLLTIDVPYFLIAIALVIGYLALYPLTVCFLAKSKGIFNKNTTSDNKAITSKNCTPYDVYTIGMTEHFFNGITPFATGGQPFQVYALTRKGVSAANATGILIMNFFVFLLVTNTYAFISLFFFTSFVHTTEMMVVTIIGFTMNFLTLLFTLLLATNKTVCKFLLWVLTLCEKIKFLENFVKKSKANFETYLNNTQSAFRNLWHDKKTFFLCYVTRGITMFLYYAVPFFILKSLHIEVLTSDIFFIICGSAFAITTVVFLPTPGSSGGIEFAFNSIFASLAGGIAASVSYSGTLLWRLATYYLPILISFMYYIFFEIKRRIDDKKINVAAADEEKL